MEDHTTRLRITIFNASGLRAADSNGLSDPYVVCEIVGKPHAKFRTRTVPETLDPEWDEEHTLDGLAAGDTLRLTVMDEDNVLKTALLGDDFLGRAELPAEELFHGFEGELPLEDAGKGHEDAVLRLAVAAEALAAPARGPAPPAAVPPPPADEGPGGPGGPGGLGGAGGAGPGGAGPGAAARGAGGARPRRLAVTLVGAHGLPGAGGGESCDAYCTCEVPGKPHARFRTEVASGTSEPMWNRSCEFDYVPGDPLVFTVLDKRIWPKSDDVIGTAVLKGDKFYPYGFDGELVIDAQPAEASPSSSVVESLKDTFGRMVHGSARNGAQATLKVKVSAVGSVLGPDEGAQPQFPLYGQRQQIDGESRRPSIPREAHLQSAPAHLLGSQKLKVLIRGARITSSLDETSRLDLFCVCQIPGRPGSGFQTRASVGPAGAPVWDQEQELPGYAPGEGLEFLVLGRPRAALGPRGPEVEAHVDVGSCSLGSERFLPYGYDAEATLASPGQGIRGLLRVAVTVGDGPPAPRAPGRPLLSGAGAAGPRRLGGPAAGGLSATAPPLSAARPAPLRAGAAPRALEPASSAARPASVALPGGVLGSARAGCAAAVPRRGTVPLRLAPAAVAAGASPVASVLTGAACDRAYLGQELPSRTLSAGVLGRSVPGYSQGSVFMR